MEWVALSAGRCGSECVEYSIVKRRQKKSCNKQVFFGNLNYRVGDANEKR